MVTKKSGSRIKYVILVVALLAACASLLYYNSQVNGSSATKQLEEYKLLYNNLRYNYSSLQNILNLTSIKLANMSVKYNATRYNLTHPYVRTLYSNYVVSIAPETYNYSANTWVYGVYNFSFDAPYLGYLVINYSVDPSNITLKSSTFWFYVSKQKPYYLNGTLTLNSYVQPYSVYAGPDGSTEIIPITNGTNYVLMQNTENKTATVDFSVKYFGLHTS